MGITLTDTYICGRQIFRASYSQTMEIDSLKVLLAVSEEKSFSGAARRLHRTQPAVSQTIKKLENDIGEVLFDRSTKDGTLTPAGTLLVDYAKQMLNLRRSARAAVSELKQLNRGRVSISANEHLIFYLLPLIGEFTKKYPMVRVDIRKGVASRIPRQIMAREAELGVVSFKPRDKSVSSVEVGTDELSLVVNPEHRLAGKKVVRISDLALETFVAHNAASPYREQVISEFERRNVDLNIGIEMPSLEAIKRLVEQGVGIALIPRIVAENELKRGTLTALKVKELSLSKQLHIVFKRNCALSHAAEAFLALARNMR